MAIAGAKRQLADELINAPGGQAGGSDCFSMIYVQFVAVLQQSRDIWRCALIAARLDTFGTYKRPLEKRGPAMHKLLRATALTSLLLGTSFAANAADLPPAPCRARLSHTCRPQCRSSAGPGSISAATLAAAGAGVTWWTLLFGVNFTNGNSTSFLGGGQVGGNYQFGSFVVGAEADFDWFANNNNSGNGTTVPLEGPPLFYG